MKKQTLLIVTLVLFFMAFQPSTNFAFSFTKTVGGTNNDFAYHSARAHDGGVVVVGSSESFGSGVLDTTDNYIIKLDPSGNVIWSRTIGSTNQEELYWVEPTADSAYVVCGTIRKLPVLPNELEVFKIDDAGNVLWKKRYTITGSEVAHCIRSVPGGFMLVCETDNGADYDFAALRLDLNGNVLWSKSYGTNEFDIPIYVEPTSDGGYLLGGNSRVGIYHSSVYIVKTDSSGNFQWSKKYNTSPAFSKCYFSRALETADHGFIISGATNADNLVINDALLIRTDSLGNIRWIYTYGEQGNDEANDMKILQDGSYLICGSTSSIDNTGLNDMMMMQTDTSGMITGSWAWGFAGQEDDAYSFVLLENNEVFVSGITDFTNSGWFDIMIERANLGQNGNCSELVPNFRRLPSTIGVISGPTISDTLLVAVSTLPVPEGQGALDSTICSTTTGITQLETQLKGFVFPNPCTHSFNYEFEGSSSNSSTQFTLSSTTGAIVLKKNLSSGSKGEIQLDGISDGIYFGEINCGEKFWRGKIVVQN
ncbi:MAG: T9SS type A sorting domain-containing protein [Bacteroidetes bacterium]|nr:T9SS type A sorting domain-containing protein [Bacteroidota bacterium]